VTTNTEEFAEVIHYWNEVLAPATPVEEHLATAIARQDFLMYALLKRAAQENKEPEFSKWMRTHRDLAVTLESLMRTLDMLQRKRLDTPPPPRAGGKLLPFRRKPTLASVGRPRKIQAEPEPVICTRNVRRQHGEDPLLDLKIAA